MRYLLEKGANIEVEDSNGWTPLIFAAKYGHLDVVKYLLERGANIEAKDKNGRSAVTLTQNNDINAYLMSKGATT